MFPIPVRCNDFVGTPMTVLLRQLFKTKGTQWMSSKNPEIFRVIHHFQNRLESTINKLVIVLVVIILDKILTLAWTSSLFP